MSRTYFDMGRNLPKPRVIQPLDIAPLRDGIFTAYMAEIQRRLLDSALAELRPGKFSRKKTKSESVW